MIPRTLLIASGPFEKLSAQGVASAISRGLAAGGFPADECPLETGGDPQADVRALLDSLHFDERMRRARAVVVAEWLLEERTLAASPAFEVATRARQAGVPAYALTATNRLSPFDARMLDLQAILEASTPRALQAAARRLAKLV
jgi:glycerate kinase